jgi:hypothetical protein
MISFSSRFWLDILQVNRYPSRQPPLHCVTYGDKIGIVPGGAVQGALSCNRFSVFRSPAAPSRTRRRPRYSWADTVKSAGGEGHRRHGSGLAHGTVELPFRALLYALRRQSAAEESKYQHWWISKGRRCSSISVPRAASSGRHLPFCIRPPSIVRRPTERLCRGEVAQRKLLRMSASSSRRSLWALWAILSSSFSRSSCLP